MIANTTRKTPRARSSEKKKASSAGSASQERIQYPVRPRRPNWLLLTISAAMFLTWLVLLVALALWQA